MGIIGISEMSTFVVGRSAALGNRIKSYVSHMARYETIKIEKPTDIHLFENFELATKEDFQKYPSTGSVWRLLVDEEEEKYIDNYKTIDQFYNKIPQYFIDKYLPIFQKIKIKPEIKKIIDDFTQDWNKNNMVGVNIRSFLPPNGDGSRSVWVDFEGYEKEIENLGPDQKIFLATDNINVTNYFINKFNDQIITYPRSVDVIRDDGSLDDITQTQEAFVEMYLLSQCHKKLYATFGSTFPECSWWFGGCKAEVFMPTLWDKVPENFLNDVYIKK